ncbi:hypothetical protein PEX1_092620 [Penicillium expansum]|uniref:Uncharacterized protein n=1 Tax=Penicillium expansum TaxID=27334 RepID=A0A0A2J231_PENEN|nr:hypothetical protein PEX2_001510 [Penicillium expansum]KGO38398.1 hypothetical protein PEX1_092620 [Penicillium expansum]KGO48708.1 hypothetical protein PEXP_074380 [Penicillium expansum]KGO57177.1 hypothetical protein PEX2_001510 [Penicillium expansum]
MLGEYGTLSAKSTYNYTNTDGWVYHDRFSKYHVTLVIDIILAENSLRSTVQREDALINKIRAAKKLTGVDDNDVKLGPLEEELKELKKTRCHRVRDLYEEESILLGISGKSSSKIVLAEEVAVAGTVDAAPDVDYPLKMGEASGIVPLNTLRSHNPAFVLRIANAYFSKPLVWKLDTKNK